MQLTQPRVIDWIEGAVNFRDFGGYPTQDGRMVRQGVLYRSGNTHGISAEGVATVAEKLGIRNVIDLRGDQERARGLTAFEDHGIRTIHEPLDTGLGGDPSVPSDEWIRQMAMGTFDWPSMYWTMLDLSRSSICRILDVLADGTPALIHCAGGRDRTGVTVAMVQAALGVDVSDIASDYALSSQLLNLGGPRPDFDRLFGGLDLPRDEIVKNMATLPSTVYDLFERIDAAHGDIDGLMCALGVEEETLLKLRANLLEPIAY